MSDLRFALRQLLKNPGFTAVAVLTLALCLGANLTLFAVINSVLLRPLPFPDSGRLVTLFNTYPKAGADRAGSTIPNYYERRGAIPAFSSLSLFGYGSVIVGEAGATERENVMRVSPEFFDTLGVRPAMGRVFDEDETTFETDRVVILTDGYWRQGFNADPGVLGRTIIVDGVAKTVVGVLSPEFRFLSSEARLFLPFASDPSTRAPERRHYGNGDEIVARLKPGATLPEAQAQLDAHNAALEGNSSVIADTGFHTSVASLQEDHVKSIQPILLLLQAGVLFLLLIGAANLANLLLIRASNRAREVSIRQSLGASRRAVVRQVIVETVLLTLTGGIFGLVVGALGIRLLDAFGVDQLPLGSRVGFDGRLALIGLLGSMVLGLVLAAPVAWFSLHGQRAHALQSESRGGTANRSAQRVRQGFIVAQIALAFVLSAGAGLLGVSLKQAMAVSPGFRPDHVLTGHLSLPFIGYQDGAARFAFADRLISAVEQQPGVTAAGAVTVAPFSGSGHVIANTPAGVTRAGGEPFHAHQTYGVMGNYFAAMGYTLREGRFLNADDGRRAEKICVVDADFAHRYWPDGSAVGQRVFQGPQPGTDADAFTIVGIVGPVKQAGLTENDSKGAVYYPYPYRANNEFYLVTRTTLPPETMSATLRTVLRGIDPGLPLDDVRTMDVRIADSLLTRRSPALLAGLFAATALLLAVIGIYGVLSYAVAQRRREIGVRMALGALPRQIATQFLSSGLRLLATGAMLGVLGAWLAGRAMQTVLFNVPALHLATLAGTIAVMTSASLAACWLPARRAARCDPMVALRSE